MQNLLDKLAVCQFFGGTRPLNAATLYPGLAMLEASKNYSVGRGTDAPFEQIAAPFIQGRELAAYLNQRQVPGVRAYPAKVGVTEGVRFVLTNRELFDSTRLGLEVAGALEKLYPGKVGLALDRKLIGSDEVIARIRKGDDPRTIEQSMVDEVAAFVKRREPYLLYR